MEFGPYCVNRKQLRNARSLIYTAFLLNNLTFKFEIVDPLEIEISTMNENIYRCLSFPLKSFLWKIQSKYLETEYSSAMLLFTSNLECLIKISRSQTYQDHNTSYLLIII